MKCRYMCVMDIGPRNEQEDCILIDNNIYQENQFENSSDFESEVMVMAVCDGMGGHDAGEEASRYVCEKLNSIVDLVNFSGESLQSIMAAVQNSSAGVLPKGSGTTVAGIVAKNNRAIVFNAGDSRVYRITNGDIACISHDHSLVQDLIDRKLINEEEAFKHPYRNVVNFGIGPAFVKAKNRYELNTYEEEIIPGSYYLICSDGVSDLLRTVEIADILREDPIEEGGKLLQVLNDKKLKDNTSYIIAEINT